MWQTAKVVSLSLVLVASSITSSPILAVNPAIWDVSLSTEGEDVFWTSPTAVDLGLLRYDWEYEITNVTAQTALFPLDLTGQLGDDQSGAGSFQTVPGVFAEGTLEALGNSATVKLEIDNQGFGQASITDITFAGGIEGLSTVASIQVTGISAPPGDYDVDGKVNRADIFFWDSRLGNTDSTADGNGNGVVDAADYPVWLANLGNELPPPPGPSVSGGGVPEPTSAVLASLLLLAGVCTRWRM